MFIEMIGMSAIGHRIRNWVPVLVGCMGLLEYYRKYCTTTVSSFIHVLAFKSVRGTRILP